MKLLDEKNLALEMENTAEPFLARFRKSGMLGGELYYETYFMPQGKGTVVISHGFCEAAPKFYEFIYYLMQNGFSAAIIEHRGHGRSVRMVRDRELVHIDDFERYVRDFNRFVTQVVIPGANSPLILFGHSMGGCIAARYLEEYPGVFEKAVLNSPMMELVSQVGPAWLGGILCDVKTVLGQGTKRLFFHSGYDPNAKFEESCCTSRERFEYYLDITRRNRALQTGGASYRWTGESIAAGRHAVRDAGKIQIPVLLVQAENDTLVTARGQDRFIDAVPQGVRVRIPGTKHETYRSENDVLERYWEILLDFLNRDEG